MTPDLEYSHTLHRQNLRIIWRSPEWKEADGIFHSLHPDNKCERCGRVAKIVPGHTSEDYNDMPSYIQKVRDNQCEALCSTCNWKESKGKKPCSECIKQHKERIRYIGQDQEKCYDCIPESDKELRASRKGKFKALIRSMQDKDNANRRKVYREIQRGTVKK